MNAAKQNNWKYPVYALLVNFGFRYITMWIGYICLFFFFKYYSIESPIPYYRRDLMQIGSTPFLWTVFFCYPSFVTKLENNKRFKIILGVITFLLLFTLYSESFVEHRFIVLFFALVLNIIGIFLRKRIYRVRYGILLISLAVMVSLFITLRTNYRTRFNIVDYQDETYAITNLIDGNAYLLRCDIEPNSDSQDTGPIIRLYRNEFLVVNVFEEDIMKNNVTIFSKVILENRTGD